MNVWRDAIRDSDLHRTAKLIAFVLSTYLDARGFAYPSKSLLAAGAGLGSTRAADYAVDRLEAAGYLNVSRSRGRSSNRYYIALPTTHRDAGFVNSNPAKTNTQPRKKGPPTLHRGAHERVERVERHDARTLDVRAASLEEKCVGCGERFVTTDVDAAFCANCSAAEVSITVETPIESFAEAEAAYMRQKLGTVAA